MLATAIIGSTVGVKNAMRSHVRPRMAEFTHSAIRIASAIETGIVPSAYQRLFVQRLPEHLVAPHHLVVLEPHPRRGALGPFGVEWKLWSDRAQTGPVA